MKDFKHYLALASILSVGFGLFWIFNYNRNYQAYITIGLGVVYIAWGTVHHLLKKEFYWHIFIEYLSVATIGCVIVIYLLSRT